MKLPRRRRKKGPDRPLYSMHSMRFLDPDENNVAKVQHELTLYTQARWRYVIFVIYKRWYNLTEPLNTKALRERRHQRHRRRHGCRMLDCHEYLTMDFKRTLRVHELRNSNIQIIAHTPVSVEASRTMNWYQVPDIPDAGYLRDVQPPDVSDTEGTAQA